MVCTTFLRCLKWLPVIFVATIVSWSYYAYMFHLVPQIYMDETRMVHDKLAVIAMVVVFHLLCFMFIWSYVQIVSTSAASIPPKFHLTSEEARMVVDADNEPRDVLARLASRRNLRIAMRTNYDEIRYCYECQAFKPDRCHHCSVCRQCVLKMDHHCPWVNNCVAFNNYKYFLLFLAYGALYCLYIVGTSLESFIEMVSATSTPQNVFRLHIVFLFLAAVVFSLSIVSLLGYHMYLVVTNRTSLEAMRPPIFAGHVQSRPYDLGSAVSNMMSVCGHEAWYAWCLPIKSTPGDGTLFAMKPHNEYPAPVVFKADMPSVEMQ